MRSTAAAILASAVCDLFPTAQLIDGQAHEWGFYYTFLIHQPIDSSFISPLEETMRGIIKQDSDVLILDMMRENAAQLFSHRKQPLKAAYVSDIPHNIVQLVRIGDFYDYITGDFVETTGEVGSIKICEIAPTDLYLASEEKNVHAIKIQGTAFPNQQLLKKFLKQREQALKRDHKIVGPECDLFSCQMEMGISDWLWHPKGTLVKNSLLELWKKEQKLADAQFVETPKVCQPAFLKKAGFFSVPENDQQLFPAFCSEGIEFQLSPSEARGYFHAWIFQQKKQAFNDLPVRYAESGEIYRKYATSQLEGLFRKSSMTTDIAHHFCHPKHLLDQIISSLHSIHKIINMVPFEWQCYLVTSEQKRKLRAANQVKVIESMQEALTTVNIPMSIESSPIGLAGPRIEFRIRDALGREWKGPYLEAHLDIAERMQLGFLNENGIIEQPLVLACSLFGSLDAFIGLLIEQCNGLLPFWLAPEQVRIIPLGGNRTKYIDEAAGKMRAAGLRIAIAEGKNPLGREIHLAEMQRVPYMVIIGTKEEKNQLISVRYCGKEHKNSQMSLEAFLTQVEGETCQTYKQE